MRKAKVTLEVIYDENDFEPPSTWAWSVFLDLPDEDHAKVVEYEDMGTVDEDSD